MTDKMIVSVSSLLPQEYHDMKAKAIRLLDLLDDVYRDERCIIPDDLMQQMLEALNDSTWVDE